MPPKPAPSSTKRNGGLYLAPPAKKSKSNPRRGSRRNERSVWNSKDDWDTLVADSSLSTSSVSNRPPRPRGLHSLVKCASDAAARGFKRLWEDGIIESDGEVIVGAGRSWKIAWRQVPVHLKVGVRDAIFRWWGSYVNLTMLQELFLIPPSLYFPGALLPCLSTVSALRSLTPARADASLITTLELTHAPKASDIMIADLIRNLPTLEVINLKGCTLVGSGSVDAMLESCSKLRSINLKGTRVEEKDVRALLDVYGQQLAAFKIDKTTFETLDETFRSEPFPALTHLCLPGDLINSPSVDYRTRARQYGQTLAYPTPRHAPRGSRVQWENFDEIFPALTHLYLPGLLVPQMTKLHATKDRLVKLSLGPGGPPVPISLVTDLLLVHQRSLKILHLGHLLEGGHDRVMGFVDIGEGLTMCDGMEDFRLECEVGGSKDARCDRAMVKRSNEVYAAALRGPWRRSLKHLSLIVPQAIDPSVFLSDDLDVLVGRKEEPTPLLETLNLPGANIKDTAAFARAVSAFKNLRSLDISATSITDEEVFVILDGCPALSRIDLTSCRGVNVRHRRNIFKAWEESRRPESEHRPEPGGRPERGRRRAR